MTKKEKVFLGVAGLAGILWYFLTNKPKQVPASESVLVPSSIDGGRQVFDLKAGRQYRFTGAGVEAAANLPNVRVVSSNAPVSIDIQPSSDLVATIPMGILVTEVPLGSSA